MRITNRLTPLKVQNQSGKGLYPDGNGLYLKITESGTKSWVYRYSTGGKLRDMGLGSIADVTLKRAREQVPEFRQQRAQGKDPIEARHAERATARAAQELAAARAMTFRDCAEQFMATHDAGWKNAKHRHQWRYTMGAYVYPVFGDLPVADVNTQLVMRVLEPIWCRATETANRLRGRIERVLSWAKVKGYRNGENPALWRGHLDHMLPRRSKVQPVRHHKALPFKEMAAFMADLRARDDIGARALELVILTALRTNEGRGARWDEFDLELGVWTVPAARMKKRKEHRIPLSRRAVAIVAEMAKIRHSEFVFPGRRPARPLSVNALLWVVKELNPAITTHGFRSVFRDWAAETTGFPNHVVEMALAHSVGNAVEAAYRRGDLFEKRRRLMEAWANYCDPAPAAKVVPLRRQRA